MAPAKYGNQLKLASYYPPELVAQLKRLSDATRIPQAAYLREALEDLLKKHAAAVRKTKG
jgi:predicted DNA-binding protein